MAKPKSSIPLQERVANEKKAYERGIDRKKYNSWFGHTFTSYSVNQRNSIFSSVLKKEPGKDVLEIGSSAWRFFINFDEFAPRRLVSINISQKELEKGRDLAKKRNTSQSTKHEFLVMDAHTLDFDDDTFDIVFGREILHHLDYDIVAREMRRVLKPGGQIVFLEPLGRNPVGKLVRYLTPNKRTRFEKPIDKNELEILNRYFDLELTYFQLFQVPAGALSRFIYKNKDNPLTHAAFRFDNYLLEKLKNTNVGLYYKQVILKGTAQ